METIVLVESVDKDTGELKKKYFGRLRWPLEEIVKVASKGGLGVQVELHSVPVLGKSYTEFEIQGEVGSILEIESALGWDLSIQAVEWEVTVRKVELLSRWSRNSQDVS